MECYPEAAEQGYDDAQFILGLMYENRWGVVKNSSMAVFWIRIAEGAGNTDAQNYLDRMTSSS